MDFDVVTIGSATRDVVMRPSLTIEDTEKSKTGKAQLLPLGSKIDVDDTVFLIGGGGTNTAISFSRKNINAGVIASIGDDSNGDDVLGHLEEEGVYTDLIQVQKEEYTAFSVIIANKESDRTILVHRGAGYKLESENIDWSFNTDWFYIASVNGNFDILDSVLEYDEKNNGVGIAWNPGSNELEAGYDKLKRYLDRTDLLFLNREEASSLTGKDYDNSEAIFKELARITKDITVVMTEGPEGVKVSDGENIYDAGVFPEKRTVDRTGAGDAFGSGFTAAIINGKPIREAIKVASANSTAVLEDYGAQRGLLTAEDLNSSRWDDLEINKLKL